MQIFKLLHLVLSFAYSNWLEVSIGRKKMHKFHSRSCGKEFSSDAGDDVVEPA